MGELLFHFYRRHVATRRRLEAQGQLELEEREAKKQLDAILDGPVEAPSLLARIEDKRSATKTGDKKLDEWYDALDTGEVPDELWGPKGPPEGWIKGPRGWKAPPDWVPPKRRAIGSVL